MIKVITVSTLEVDDPKEALMELGAQFNPDTDLMKHSIGIITCTPEFIETGIVKAVNDFLPFDTIGMTTLACSTNTEEGLDVLSLSVFTSDDVEFASGISKPISEDNLGESISDVYNNVLTQMSSEPKLIIPFGPLLPDVSGEKIIEKIFSESGSIPVFGSMACSPSFVFDKTYVFHNGEEYLQSLALLMISGDINPRFIISTISDDKITKQKSIITDSDGSTLKEVNGLNLLKYMNTIGLSQGDGIEGSSSIPFVVDYGDGTKPSVRGIYSINEEGYAFCGGDMPTGCTLAIGSLDPVDIVKTAGEATKEAMEIDDINGILFFPCQARNHILEMDYMAEMEKVREIIGDSVPYHLAYSGGEICPSYDNNGEPVNRYHNFTFVACIL